MAKINVAGLAANDGEIFKTRAAGQYPAVIAGSELKETGPDSKHPGSPMLKITVKLPEFEGMEACQIFHNIILPNEDYMDAEQMRKKTAEVKRLKMAVGLPNDDTLDTDELLNLEFLAVVGEETQKEGQYAGKKQNRITDFLSL